jgi:hypothetical protein
MKQETRKGMKSKRKQGTDNERMDEKEKRDDTKKVVKRQIKDRRGKEKNGETKNEGRDKERMGEKEKREETKKGSKRQ